MKTSCYVAPGFELIGDVLTFATPSASLASDFINLTFQERRKLVDALKDEGYFSFGTYQVWMIDRGLSPYPSKSLVWEINDGNIGTWITRVFVEEPLSSELLKRLVDTTDND
jgi:hypothetical protein